MQKKKVYIYAAFSALLAFGCTELQRDNPFDPDGVNYAGSGEPASSGGSSSSAKEVGSSSSVAGGGSSSSVVYETVKIGNQVWMKKNLDIVPATGNSDCYNYQEVNCIIYGRLYDWATAMALPSSCNSSSCESQIKSPHRGICPEGWHIPSADEWMALFNAVGGSSIAGRELKATNGWHTKWDDDGKEIKEVSGDGLDTYGFRALPGGYINSAGNPDEVGSFGYWWAATYAFNEDDNEIQTGYMTFWDSGAHCWHTHNKLDLVSVRCLKD